MESVKEIEKLGFNIQGFMNKPVTFMDILWYGGFIANHKNVNQNLSLKIIPLIFALFLLYQVI